MSIDTNIDNYTIEDMEDFLELPPDYTESYVNMLIDSIPIYDDEKLKFIEEMRKRILNSMGVTDIAESKNAVNLPLTYENPYEKDNTNPFVTREVPALISLNTRFILNDNNSYSTHDYTVNLTEKIQRVKSISISDIHLPTTWYTIASENEGTIEFTLNNESLRKIIIPKGTYTILTLIDAVNEEFKVQNSSTSDIFVYDADTDKVRASLDDGYTLTVTIYNHDWGFRKPYRSIGRILGFRDNTTILSNTHTPPFDYDLDGTKYVMVVVDDFTRNSYSGGIIGTDAVITKAKIPEYVRDCECPEEESDRVIYASKKPGLTYHELYTVNEIALNRIEPLPEMSPRPNEVLGIIPVYPGTTPYPITSSGHDISGGIRTYFGPVSISKLRVRLLDDGGEPLDIRNEDWFLTLSVSMMYQY